VLRTSKKPVASSSLVRALVVDDNAAVRTFVAHVLCQAGYYTATAEDGVAACEYVLATGAPDIVVTDESMPRMTGHEFACWVRQQRSDVKVLFLTGNRTDVLRDEVCLEKPCTMRTLLDTVSRLTASSEPQPDALALYYSS
jgi:CheY-like chemotaxis protein